MSQFLKISQDLYIGTRTYIFLDREFTPVASVSVIFVLYSLTMTRLSSVSLLPGTMCGTEGRSADVCRMNLNQKPGESGVFYSPSPVGW